MGSAAQEDAPKSEEKVVKQKRRLQMWKIHADRLGTEAPRPGGGSPPRLKMTKRQKKELVAKRQQEEAGKRACEEVATQAKAPRRDAGAMREASEQAAREALEAGDTSLQAVQRALDMIELPASSN